MEVMLRADKVLSPTDLHFLLTHVWPVVGLDASPAHPCRTCGRDVTGLAVYCEQCAYKRTRENQKRYWREHNPQPEKFCLDCGEDITGCTDCGNAASTASRNTRRRGTVRVRERGGRLEHLPGHQPRPA